jgi:hypothetical protein
MPFRLCAHYVTGVCTLQPGGLTFGQIEPTALEQLVCISVPAVVMNSEILHRGGATPPVAVADGAAGWVSSCSIELCSASGWCASIASHRPYFCVI